MKTLRRIRRNICRYIVGFDSCPSGYRRNPWRTFTNIILAIALILVVLTFFLFLVICL